MRARKLRSSIHRRIAVSHARGCKRPWTRTEFPH
jgi:hypothetical protein